MKTGTSNAKFPNIFTPGSIGRLSVKNRLVRAPMASNFHGKDGCVTDRTIKHYREFARGGAGLIIVGEVHVDDKASRCSPCGLSISSAEHQPGLGWLAETIKEYGAKACLQLSHGGKQTFLGREVPLKAPSRVPWEDLYEMFGVPVPEELSLEEIEEIVEAFGNAAFRAKEAGFDMVDLLGNSGYLITNFLSPRDNKRSDWYGGSLENRMRFLLQVVRNIRRKVGGDYPLSVRLSGIEYEEGGITVDETKVVAIALERAGVDVVHITAGTHHVPDMETVTMYGPLASNVEAAKEIKKVVHIPVIVNGAITSPELAEKILAEGSADFVGLARPLLADPYFPLKAKEGRPEDIRPCIRCMEGCGGERGGVRAIHCTVNATVGREEDLRITPTSQARTVAVVGGGPAGMEAARVAALSGHKVTLYEKRKLGGMLIEASLPEFKTDLRSLINNLSTQVKKAGVKIVESEATAQTIKAGNFDVVIVAAGATPFVPEVRGLDKPLVIDAFDVLRGAKTGADVVIVGGGAIGCDVALFLAEQGKRVTITTRQDDFAHGLTLVMKIAFFKRFFRPGVMMYTGMHLVDIVDNGVVMADRFGKETALKSDNVVLVAGLKPLNGLYDELAQVPGLEVYAVGNCVEPRTIFDAIHEGYKTAQHIR